MPGAPLRRSSVESDAARRLLLVADGLLSAGSADDVVLVHAIAADAYGPDQASAPEERNAPGENLQAVGETGYARATVVRHSLLDEGLKEHFPHELQLQPVVEDAEAGDRPRVRTVLRSVYAVGEEGTAEEADCPVAEGDRTVQPDAVARSGLDEWRELVVDEAAQTYRAKTHRPRLPLGEELLPGGWRAEERDAPGLLDGHVDTKDRCVLRTEEPEDVARAIDNRDVHPRAIAERTPDGGTRAIRLPRRLSKNTAHVRRHEPAIDRRRSCTIYRWEEAVLPAHVRQHRPLHTAEVLGSEDGGWAVPGHDLPDPTQRVK